jgi:N-acyl-L-homoserine lactone synthetase
MIHLSTRAPCAPGNAALRAMFAARKQVFVDLLQWDLPVLGGQYEIDQFDTPDARYLILLDADGRHRAFARLLPSDAPHLLGDLYPYLCSGAVPRGPTIHEISRFCLDRKQDAVARRAGRDPRVTPQVDHALREGITDYTGVADEAWLTQILRFGWQCEALGPPVDDGGSRIAALRIRIDAQTIDGLKRTGVHAPLALHLAESREAIA